MSAVAQFILQQLKCSEKSVAAAGKFTGKVKKDVIRTTAFQPAGNYNYLGGGIIEGPADPVYGMEAAMKLI